MNNALAGAVAALLLPTALFAQNTELPAQRITGSAQTLYAASVLIDRAAIERAQANDVVELLRSVAGLEVNRSGGIGQQTSVFLRGAESNTTAILVDGVRINAALGGAALQNLRPSMIERIEVVKGPRAGQFGADAVGGVIHITTRSRGDDAGIRLRAGSQDTRDAGLHLRHDSGDAYFGLVADYLESDGISPFIGGSQPSGYRNFSGLLQGGGKLGDVDLDARYLISRGRGEYQSDGISFTPLAADFRNEVAAVSASEQVNETWYSRLTVSYANDDLRQLDSSDYARSTRRSLSWANQFQLGQQQISITAHGTRERIDMVSYGSIYDEERDYWGAHIEDSIRFGRQQLSLGVAYLDDEAYGDYLTWSAEYGIDLTAASQLFATAGSGVSAPLINERSGPYGNPDLDAEKARNIEIGLRHRSRRAGHYELRLFRLDTRDLIAFAGTGNANIARARNEGIELAWDWSTGPWALRANAVWQDPRNSDTDARLLRRARRTATAAVDRRFGEALDLGLEVIASGDRADVDAVSFAATTTAGYALVNLTAGYRLMPALTLRARVENLGDIDYQTVSGYQQPGRSYYVSLDYNWR